MRSDVAPIATKAPWSNRRFAMANPMPVRLPAPVTIAVWLCRGRFIVSKTTLSPRRKGLNTWRLFGVQGRQPLLDAADAEVFDFKKLLDAVFGTLSAEAGFLYAAEGSDLCRNDPGVDADDAIF